MAAWRRVLFRAGRRAAFVRPTSAPHRSAPVFLNNHFAGHEIITPERLEDSQPLKAAPQEALVVALARA